MFLLFLAYRRQKVIAVGTTGIPRVCMESNNHAKPIECRILPSVADAVSQYQAQGRHLTDPHQVGADPLEGNVHKCQIRQNAFSHQYISFF